MPRISEAFILKKKEIMYKYEFKILNNEFFVEGRNGLKIYFNKNCPEKYISDKCLVGLNDNELKKALKKPFILLEDLGLRIEYESNKYNFTIPKGYDWNGANVPCIAWCFIGQQKEPRFKLASMVHDYICENKETVLFNRYLSTLVFETLCEHFGRFNAFKRWLMFHSVDNFQKFQNWKNN